MGDDDEMGRKIEAVEFIDLAFDERLMVYSCEHNINGEILIIPCLSVRKSIDIRRSRQLNALNNYMRGT